MAAEAKGPLAQLLREPFDDKRAERLAESVLERHESKEAGARAAFDLAGLLRPSRLALAAAATLVIAVAGWIVADVASQPQRSGPLRLESREVLASLDNESGAEPRLFRLEDASTIELWPETSLVTERNTGERLDLALSQGKAVFRVEPGGPRRWRVDAGLAAVEVIGTVFTVDRRQESLAVEVERGHVVVTSSLIDSGRRDLRAGERIELNGDGHEEAEIEPAQVDGSPIREDEESDAAVTEADAGPARSARWRRLAGEGDFHGAWDALGSSGARRVTREARSMSELLELADVARRSGHPSEAVAPLELSIERYPADRRAAVAAFTLGRVEADGLGRPARAARAFQRCLELGPPQALRETAQARLAQAHAGAGNYAGARATAREYLRRYPDGRYADQLMRWVEPGR